MDAESRRFVRTRADHRCEYCRIYERLYPDFAFHISWRSSMEAVTNQTTWPYRAISATARKGLTSELLQ